MEKKIAVLIPCYNESVTIAKVVADYRAALPEADIYVYDNNSSDGTDEIARTAGAIVRYEYRQGKGNVIRSMFRNIDADCYLMADGDDPYPAEAAPELVAAILRDGYDMAIGDRLSSTYFTENKRPFHNLGNRLVRGMVNFIFRGKVRDIMTGYRAFGYDFVKCTPILSDGFEVETEMTVSALDRADFDLNEEDFETAIDVVRALRGVVCAFTVKENRDGKFKASLRSTGLNVAAVASSFRGGGHDRAAGCAIPARSMEEATDKLIAAIRRQMAEEGL